MTESVDESQKFHKGFAFWVHIFHGFIFLGLILLGIYFSGYHKNVWAEPPCQINLRVYSLGGKVIKIKKKVRKFYQTLQLCLDDFLVPNWLVREQQMLRDVSFSVSCRFNSKPT